MRVSVIHKVMNIKNGVLTSSWLGYPQDVNNLVFTSYTNSYDVL